ncbi:hypothetical protein DIPPA_08947 [Diplonema papillatum]|nr:hypothetical protein DIPPA_08947 [Diplonema papillatum]
MKRVRIFGEPTGDVEAGKPRRLDLLGGKEFTLEIAGGPVIHGEVQSAGAPEDGGSPQGQEREQEGEEEVAPSLFIAEYPKSRAGETFSAVVTDDFVLLDGVKLPRTTANAFSVCSQKAGEAVKSSHEATHTQTVCEKVVGDTVHNWISNMPALPQLNVSPPKLLSDLVDDAMTEMFLSDGGEPRQLPARVQNVVVDGEDVYGLSLPASPIAYNDLRCLASLLRKDSSLRLLRVSGSLDVKGVPPIPADELAKEEARVTAEWGPIPTDEEDEKLEKLKAAIAPAEYTAPEAAMRILAKQNLCRPSILLDALLENTTLRMLDLSQNSLGVAIDGRKSFKLLRKAKRMLDEHPSLQKVDLSGNYLGPKGVGVIMKGLAQNISASDVDLSDNGIGDEEEEENDDDAEGDDPAFGEPLTGLEAIADMLKKNKFLKTLRLCHNRIKCADLAEDEELTDSYGEDVPLYKMLLPLRSFHRLTSLNLSGNELGSGGAYIVGCAVKHNRSLVALDISECDLGPVGVEAFMKQLLQANNLRKLEFRRNGFAGLKGKKQSKLSAKAIAAFAEFLKSEANHLRHLDVAYNNLGAEGGRTLLAAMTQNSKLHTLNLSMNQLCGTTTGEFAAEGVEALAQLIEAVAVRHLFLKWNFLQDQGAKLLAPSLEKSSVAVLDVSHNHLRQEGLAAICGAAHKVAVLRVASSKAANVPELCDLLQRSEQLLLLDVEDSLLGAAGVPLLEAAKQSSSLVSLRISRNKLGPDAAPQVGALLESLHTLLAGDNDFGTAAIVEHVVPNLMGNKKLRRLEIWGGQGPPTETLAAVAQLFGTGDGPTSLLSLNIGVALTSGAAPADVNAISESLYKNLSCATFGSALELAA